MKAGTGYLAIAITLAALTNFRCSAIVCYKCDSIALEGCAMSLNETELPFEDCGSSTLNCAMSIVDSITYRGCASNTPTNGATYTKSCSENLCNKGVYPPGRLKCYHCNAADDGCKGEQTSKTKPCRYHHEYDECYTEVSDAGQVYRGCRSDTNHTIDADSALLCDINGCNNEVAVRTLKCAVCDSRSGRGCKMDLFEVNSSNCNITQYDTCEVNSLLTRSESCYVYQNLGHVVRGCSSDMPDVVQRNLNKIEVCSDKDLCNASCLQQQKCVICDSTTSRSCRTNATQTSNITCGSAEASSCFACETVNWQVRRGCGTPALSSDVNRCYECDEGDGCNYTPFARCYKCSSRDDANCASWERPGEFLEIEECAAPGASCVMAAFADGVTLRGCASDYLHCNETVPNCERCEGSFCNKGSYPANRLRCYQCTAGSDECTDAAPCVPPITEPTTTAEACFEYFDTQLAAGIRGCRSNSAQYVQCLYHMASCRTCYDDGCNSSILSATMSLKADKQQQIQITTV